MTEETLDELLLKAYQRGYKEALKDGIKEMRDGLFERGYKEGFREAIEKAANLLKEGCRSEACISECWHVTEIRALALKGDANGESLKPEADK